MTGAEQQARDVPDSRDAPDSTGQTTPESGKTPRTLWRFLDALVIPAVASIFAIAFLRGIDTLPTQSATYPRILIVALLVLVAVNVVLELGKLVVRKSEPDAPESGPPESGPPEFVEAEPHAEPRALVKPVTLIGLMALFVFCMPKLGFYLTGAVLVPLITVVLGIRKWWLIAVFTVVLIGAAYLLFELFLEVPLPTGVLG